MKQTSRRDFLKFSAALGATVALAACTQQSPAPSANPTTGSQAPAPTATAAPQAAAAPTATAAPQAAAGATPTAAGEQMATIPGGLKPVAREDTLITVRGGAPKDQFQDWNLWNPYNPLADHQRGPLMVCEPLAFYSAFGNKEYLWLAESYQFSNDYKSLTIKVRDGIKWSDGEPFTADDVTWTLNEAAKMKEKVRWGTDIALVAEKIETLDKLTTKITFSIPAPRFFYSASYHFDFGYYIMPKHIFEGRDLSSFEHFDLEKGWPVTTSPWRVVQSGLHQKILDRADDWWGVKAGVGKLPEPKRYILLPDLGEQALVSGIIKNEYDFTTGIQPSSFPTVFQGNPKAHSWTGNKPPYGYVDFWPHSLYVNTTKAPWSDKNVRWALSYYLDRDKVVEIAWSGASKPTALPMPDYPPLKPYWDATQELLQKYNTLEYNPAKGDELLTAKGWKKDSNGMWQDETGQPVKLEIISFFDFTSVGPVVVEMLKRGGIDATYSEPPDIFTRFAAGNYTGCLFGHGSSCKEIYETLRLYQSKSEAIPGGHAVNFSRWSNPEFDKLTDEAWLTPPDQVDKLVEIWKKAMAIWLPELPDIMLTHGYHRLPWQETYWTGFPDENDPYVNSAMWHLTFPLVMHRLTKAKA